ncbi:arylsulfatase A-like enzyme [Kibdelosporangium banguiense]|uniref:Arylsulfatase A-like enzyme n=1 Tax=Kibdelosporangium banguiense TaxID=1365924 RepID=A0ABS4TR46_9PSEU|nr:sulfatase-like hydrolase/transferase [Kibdelosporangium banguiense]MBP2326420.1 arylsulfatase A-like enzyme [Kibdelosporangium banguiense]
MREISRRSAGALAGAALASTALPAEAGSVEAGQTKKPNVLVILADDLGWGNLSCYGSPNISTPNLDALATQGIRFTDGYSAAAVCSPTRFALYTGRYPGRLPGGLAEPIAQPNELEGLPADHPTLASLLRQAGYSTAMYGKWHCGYLPWYSPVRSGWQEFFGNFAGGLDYYSKISTNATHDLYEGEVPVESLDYYTDTLTERAVSYIKRPHTSPWLLNLNYTTPHWPWEAPGDVATSQELTARVKTGDRLALVHLDGGSLDIYRRMVESLDAAVGQVLRALQQSGQERDTLVLFISDNGGERFSYHWPFSGNKDELLEGGIRVPTILRWPAKIRGHQTSRTPVITQDWTATILAVAGAQPAPSHPLDGLNLADHLWSGAPAPTRDLFWRTRSQAALRRDRWKYYRSPAGEYLFDLGTDEHEQANLAKKQPALVTTLRTRWDEINSGLLPYPPRV